MLSKGIEQTLALGSVALLLFSISSVTVADSDFAKLCNGNHVEISLISQAKAIVAASKSTSERSCQQFNGSLAALEPILEQVESGKVCQSDFVDKLSQYHTEFIRSKSVLIPQALRDFLMSLSAAIGSRCKATLFNSLKASIEGKVTEEDYSAIPSEQAKQEAEEFDIDDLLLAEDIKRLLAGKRSDKFAMLVNVEVGERFRKLVVACETKFKPIYSQLVVPIIKMSKLGYVGEKDDLLLRKWFKIVQVCESLSVADVYEDTANIVEDKKSLTFVSQDKAKELRKAQLSINEAVAFEEQLIDFTPTISTNLILDDEVPAANLNELEKLVMRPQKSHGVMSLIKKQIKSKLISALASGKMRLKSLASLKCSLRGKCVAELEDVPESALEEISNANGSRGKRFDAWWSTSGILTCIVIIPCAILVIEIYLLLLSVAYSVALINLGYSKIMHKEKPTV